LTSLSLCRKLQIRLRIRKTHLFLLAGVMLTMSAQAVPLTHFVTNPGGFDAYLYPELLDGTPSLEGGIFTLPTTVNPGFVIILDDASSNKRDPNSWFEVIRFFDSGSGIVNSVQMLTGGPNQASYFPSLSTVRNSPNAFIVRGQITGGGGPPMFTDFTQYSVVAQQTRNYHFYTGPFPIPDGGSTLIFLSFAIAMLVAFRRKLQRP
jgi:hypothetical protein